MNENGPTQEISLSAPMNTVLRVAGRVEDSIVDGPGLRFVLFLQGCTHHCPGCHNPETHDRYGGVLVSAAEIWQTVRRNPLIQGVTLSGGEPFDQAEALLPLVTCLRGQGYHLMAYTGYVFEELIECFAWRHLLALLDLVVDGPYLQAEHALNLRYKGSRNQRVIRVQASLQQGCVVLD